MGSTLKLGSGTSVSVIPTSIKIAGKSTIVTSYSVKDVDVIFTDNIINNASDVEHGYLPKLTNDTTKFLRADGTWSQANQSSEIVEVNTELNLFPFTQILYRNKTGDNNVSTDIVPNFTITSIDTVNHTMIVSDLPPGVDLMNSNSGNKWVIINVDSWLGTQVGYTGNPRAIFQVDAVNTGTKEITYTYYNNGWVEGNNIATNRLVFFNPFEDGFTRDTANPIFEPADFISLGSYTFFASAGCYWKQNGDFVQFIYAVKSAGGWDMLYGTTSDFVTWIPGNSIIFASKPTWANSYFLPKTQGEYLKDEGVYFMFGKGYNDSTGVVGVGWIKFSDDLSTYEIAPASIISDDEIDVFLSDYSGIEIDTYTISDTAVVENNGTWYMGSMLYTKFTGTHTGGNGVTILTDSNHYFEPNTLVMQDGTPIKNTTAVTSGTISANTLHTISTNINWDTGDTYEIDGVMAWRLIISISDTRYGPFRIVKMAPLRDYVNDGTSGSLWNQNQQMFVYKGTIYIIFAATAKYITAGTKGKYVADIYKLDPYTYDIVRLPSNPFFTGILLGDVYGYPEYDWEADHISGVKLVVDETNNKLHIIYDGTSGTDLYKIGHAYKDLDTIL